jgi:1-deoxy-D-xylulose-5-phosphate reductoisomerase
MSDSIVILGSTGSIGVNTLLIASKYNIEIEALSAGDNIDLLNQQIAQYKPKFVAIRDKKNLHKVNHNRVYCGDIGILELLENSSSKTVVNALVGYMGLAPTLKAISLNRKVALANKESLVVAGEFIDMSKITPIDSEHFGLWYLMGGRKADKLYITASGGAFRDWSISNIKNASFKDALKHPNWSMGNKITIDSATMTNKLFELLEAKWLFNTTNIDAVIERKSIIHALVQFKDGSTTAHYAGVDMKLPIAFALRGEVEDLILPQLDLLEIGDIKFEPINKDKYPIWEIKEHLLNNPHLGVVVNSANEEAIKAFESGECNFFDMSRRVLSAYNHFNLAHPKSIDEVKEIDREVRAYMRSIK